jgi:Anti-sigma-K factor rskA/Putative zinc-finger
VSSHEEFLELCASATAGELNVSEQTRLDAHLAECPECRRVMNEYEVAAQTAVSALAQDFAMHDEASHGSWSAENAEKAFFKRLNEEQDDQEFKRTDYNRSDQTNVGKRFTYRPSQIRWLEIWMPFAAAVLLALALGISAYKTGVMRGIDAARMAPKPERGSESSLEARASDAGYERVQFEAKLADNAKVIDDLKRQLLKQIKVVRSLRSTDVVAGHPSGSGSSQESLQDANEARAKRDEESTAAQAKLAELQKAFEAATEQRDENARQGVVLEAKVDELTQLVKNRERALDQKGEAVAKGQELLEHDRDIRELMGARQLYMADVRDLSGGGTDKTYGRVFYTKGKSLIFYAFDLDAQPGPQNASSFQAWGLRGPDKQQALNLGIFYEDNVSKKRWVLKANDPKTLEDIDAVFVTVEPNGGSHHPSGKQLLFAYLRASPNHP